MYGDSRSPSPDCHGPRNRGRSPSSHSRGLGGGLERILSRLEHHGGPYPWRRHGHGHSHHPWAVRSFWTRRGGCRPPSPSEDGHHESHAPRHDRSRSPHRMCWNTGLDDDAALAAAMNASMTARDAHDVHDAHDAESHTHDASPTHTHEPVAMPTPFAGFLERKAAPPASTGGAQATTTAQRLDKKTVMEPLREAAAAFFNAQGVPNGPIRAAAQESLLQSLRTAADKIVATVNAPIEAEKTTKLVEREAEKARKLAERERDKAEKDVAKASKQAAKAAAKSQPAAVAPETVPSHDVLLPAAVALNVVTEQVDAADLNVGGAPSAPDMTTSA